MVLGDGGVGCFGGNSNLSGGDSHRTDGLGSLGMGTAALLEPKEQV